MVGVVLVLCIVGDRHQRVRIQHDACGAVVGDLFTVYPEVMRRIEGRAVEQGRGVVCEKLGHAVHHDRAVEIRRTGAHVRVVAGAEGIIRAHIPESCRVALLRDRDR